MDEAAPLLALLLLFGLGGKKTDPADPNAPVPQPGGPGSCPPGQRWNFRQSRCINVSCPPGTVLAPGTGLCITPDGPVPEPPAPPSEPENVDDIIDDYPTDGAFFQVSPGWIFSGVPSSGNGKRILYDAVAQRAFLVARDAMGMNVDQARAWARTVANVQENRAALMRGIMRDPWNDQLYATLGYSALASPDTCTKRAIRLLPQHANNAQRLRDGVAPIRSIRMGTPGGSNGLAAQGAPSGNFELLWINPIDQEHLRLTKQVRVLMTGPPEFVRELGIFDMSGAPANTEWGC